MARYHVDYERDYYNADVVILAAPCTDDACDEPHINVFTDAEPESHDDAVAVEQ